MTFLRKISKSNENNVIVECHHSVTFNEVTKNINKIITQQSKTPFRKDLLFINIDKFYSFTGNISKEIETEKYFIIFFKNELEFEELITNENIDIDELNNNNIYFIYVIPNNFEKIEEKDIYSLFNHIFIEKQILEKKDLKGDDIFEKSGFQHLSVFNQMDIIKDFELSEETIDKLSFTGIISEEIKDWYKKNYLIRRENGISKFKNKLMTIF